MVAVRPPAVAGRFYPGHPKTLAAQVDSMLDAVEVPADDVLAPAYVVPHAGHRYSGPTAAHVYARLRAHAAEIERIVLVGPAHFVPLTGCAVPTVDGWATPLGEVALDSAACAELVSRGHAVASDEPHAPEHSLEVQLPFVQRTVPGVPVLPIAVGLSTVDSVGAALNALRANGSVLLCSTDLSHYLDDATARGKDEATIKAVLERDPGRIGTRDACGVFALRGLTALAADLDWTPRVLDYSTSADTAGAPDRVVGYVAMSVA